MTLANMIPKYVFATRVRANIRRLRGPLPDEAVRRQTLAISEQLVPVCSAPSNEEFPLCITLLLRCIWISISISYSGYSIFLAF